MHLWRWTRFEIGLNFLFFYSVLQGSVIENSANRFHDQTVLGSLFRQTWLLFILGAMPGWIQYRLTDGWIHTATSDALARVKFAPILSLIDIICENATWKMRWVALFGSLIESGNQSLGENAFFCIILWGFIRIFEKSEAGVRAISSFYHSDLGLLFEL